MAETSVQIILRPTNAISVGRLFVIAVRAKQVLVRLIQKVHLNAMVTTIKAHDGESQSIVKVSRLPRLIRAIICPLQMQEVEC